MTKSNPLKVQIRTVLQKYTKSSRIDEMVDEILEVISRDAPKVQVSIPYEPCNHMYRLLKNEVGTRELICKKCGRVKDIKFDLKEDAKN